MEKECSHCKDAVRIIKKFGKRIKERTNTEVKVDCSACNNTRKVISK